MRRLYELIFGWIEQSNATLSNGTFTTPPERAALHLWEVQNLRLAAARRGGGRAVGGLFGAHLRVVDSVDSEIE